MSDAVPCMGRSEQRGRPCRLPGTPRADGWVGCGHHPERPELQPEADGDGEHVARVNELLVEAMNHAEWQAVPGAVRRIIEHAWVELDRATEVTT